MKNGNESPLHKRMKRMSVNQVIEVDTHVERAESHRIAVLEGITIQTWKNKISGKGFQIKRTK